MLTEQKSLTPEDRKFLCDINKRSHFNYNTSRISVYQLDDKDVSKGACHASMLSKYDNNRKVIFKTYREASFASQNIHLSSFFNYIYGNNSLFPEVAKNVEATLFESFFRLEITGPLTMGQFLGPVISLRSCREASISDNINNWFGLQGVIKNKHLALFLSQTFQYRKNLGFFVNSELPYFSNLHWIFNSSTDLKRLINRDLIEKSANVSNCFNNPAKINVMKNIWDKWWTKNLAEFTKIKTEGKFSMTNTYIIPRKCLVDLEKMILEYVRND